MGPVTLLILDGWGVSTEKKGNSILAARTPNYNKLIKDFAYTTLLASGEAVGLPPGLMGNSEVGHLTIGTGRVITQKLTLISNAIADGSFFANPSLLSAIEHVKRTGGKLHILGLLSDGCVHSSMDHLSGLIQMAHEHKINKVLIHPILDGRDTPPRSARRFLKELQEKLAGNATSGTLGDIGVICGRYYAMDRDQRWDRLKIYWDALVLAIGREAPDALWAIDNAYEAHNENDEFVKPYIVTKATIESGDSVICFNFRPDRVRQISRVLTQPDFAEFERPVVPDVHYVCMTEYDSSLKLPVAFNLDSLPPQDVTMTLPELISCNHMKQLHTAETEKYAHVTYFLNGGREQELEGEDRILVPSLKVATYDQAPQMQTSEVTNVACKAIESGQYPFIVLNLANPDMVGHTGFMEAAVDAVQSVDQAFGQLLAATQSAHGTLLITADHGNVEQMIDLDSGEPHTAHTTSPVPFIIASFQENDKRLQNKQPLKSGGLADVAPTILDLMNIAKPKQMNGKSLLS